MLTFIDLFKLKLIITKMIYFYDLLNEFLKR